MPEAEIQNNYPEGGEETSSPSVAPVSEQPVKLISPANESKSNKPLVYGVVLIVVLIVCGGIYFSKKIHSDKQTSEENINAIAPVPTEVVGEEPLTESSVVPSSEPTSLITPATSLNFVLPDGWIKKSNSTISNNYLKYSFYAPSAWKWDYICGQTCRGENYSDNYLYESFKGVTQGVSLNIVEMPSGVIDNINVVDLSKLGGNPVLVSERKLNNLPFDAHEYTVRFEPKPLQEGDKVSDPSDATIVYANIEGKIFRFMFDCRDNDPQKSDYLETFYNVIKSFKLEI